MNLLTGSVLPSKLVARDIWLASLDGGATREFLESVNSVARGSVDVDGFSEA